MIDSDVQMEDGPVVLVIPAEDPTVVDLPLDLAAAEGSADAPFEAFDIPAIDLGATVDFTAIQFQPGGKFDFAFTSFI
jgi:hypothetical protein